MLKRSFCFLILFFYSVKLIPVFDHTALMSRILVPADVAIGSVIYRLRATDTNYDFPLIFSLEEESTVIGIESLNCTRFNSVCQSNVIVQRHLEAGVFYDFVVVVRNRNNQVSRTRCSFRATNATTPFGEIFPGAPSLLEISESAPRNTELGTLIVKGDKLKERGVLLEIWGWEYSKFTLRQKIINERGAEGAILLFSQLDYETTNLYHLTILANDVWTEAGNDTRNIVGWPLVVAVLDEQDTPPVFTLAPPVTQLNANLKPGDLILKVHAEDGDKGKPRDIRYGLLPEENPLSSFFTLSKNSGQLRLARPLLDLQALTDGNSPIVLSIIAEEIRTNANEPPAQSTTVHLALVPPPPVWDIPHFSNSRFMTRLEENALPGTNLNLSQIELIVQPGEVLTLELENNNGTFEVVPSVIQNPSKFSIVVRDNQMLDYEVRKSVECVIVAKEFKTGNHTVSAKLIILLVDVNDNPPIFDGGEYSAEIFENSKEGTSVLEVHATDVDTGIGGKVRYTGLTGVGSQNFRIDPSTGLVTVTNSKGLDAEKMELFVFTVEAADEDGIGLKATAQLNIRLLDLNDEYPKFEKEMYEFIVDVQKRQFTSPAFIKAIDLDVTNPNNVVRYELITKNENVSLNVDSGELKIKRSWITTDIITLMAEAYDGGTPSKRNETVIKIYPPESKIHTFKIVMPGINHDPEIIEKKLNTLTGGDVTVQNIEPFLEDDVKNDNKKSLIYASVRYPQNAIVDFDQIESLFQKKENMEKQRVEIQKAGVSSTDNLWWLFLILSLLLLLALILLLCCFCEACPLYVPPNKRKIAATVITPQNNGKRVANENKSIQVAEWFGRREAWSPEGILVENEVDSLRRHEMDRGSDKDLRRKVAQKRESVDRDHLYIREGNTDILRLITRGGEQQQNHQKHYFLDNQNNMIDSGKEILLKRFIDQQGNSQMKLGTTGTLPNETLQREDNLETILKQQNSLLRQIILEREREVRLETQSLPAGTQTDKNAGTQTEQLYVLRPPQRKIYSDNDVSDGTDAEDELLLTRLRGRKRKDKKRRLRKITTPIREESEEYVEQSSENQTSSKNNEYLRDRILKGISKSEVSKLGINKDILTEIFNSLDTGKKDILQTKLETKEDDLSSDNSLEEEENLNTLKNKLILKQVQKYLSEADLTKTSSPNTKSSQLKTKSRSQQDLTQVKPPKSKSKNKSGGGGGGGGGGSRYMEWYTKNKKNNDNKFKEEEEGSSKSTRATVKIVENLSKESKKSKNSESSTATSSNSKSGSNKRHHLIQHSERRFEPRKKKEEDNQDVDSGIAIVKPAITKKKSIFSIAYDDVASKNIMPDSSTPS